MRNILCIVAVRVAIETFKIDKFLFFSLHFDRTFIIHDIKVTDMLFSDNNFGQCVPESKCLQNIKCLNLWNRVFAWIKLGFPFFVHVCWHILTQNMGRIYPNKTRILYKPSITVVLAILFVFCVSASVF